MSRISLTHLAVSSILALTIFMTGCNSNSPSSAAVPAVGQTAANQMMGGSGLDGPPEQGPKFPRQDGNATAGRDVFRFETFGNEGFWTDAVRLPKGMKDKKVTPLDALGLGLMVDSEAVDKETMTKLMEELKADPTGRTSKILTDPKMTAKLINANAVIGMPIKDTNGDGVLEVEKGDKVGASCALCHSITDGSVFILPNGGSIGRRLDGRANHNLNMGKIFATAANSRALFPILQLTLKANKGKTFGRAPTGLTAKSTEEEVDAYLSNPKFYPVGMFDDTFDGNGDPMQNTPLFRQDLAAPYGSEGALVPLDNFSNLVYTSLLDLTTLTTPGGRAFLHKLGGAAGDEIADGYLKVLAATGVKGYPFVKASPHPNPGSEDAPVGLRVDNTKLMDLNAYMVSLPAPPGAQISEQAYASGQQVFRTAGCTSCHNLDQSKPVPSMVIPMKRIFPGDNPMVIAPRQAPLTPVEGTPGATFDAKMAVVNASLRGDIRGVALPLLLDLARKPAFLHDKSVAGLDELFDSKRGSMAPHPFFVSNPQQRADLVLFLKALDTTSHTGATPAAGGR
jgi:cytochrome c2